MTKIKDEEFWSKQISLTEWYENIGHKLTSEMREEDNLKRERLRVLHNTIGLPFDEPHQFEAKDISNPTTNFDEFLKTHGTQLCALRLIPKEKNLAKLRMRGKSVLDAVQWFFEQEY